MKIVPGESIVAQGGGLMVTSHRIRAEFESWGTAVIDSIPLEELSYSAIRRVSYPFLAVLAGVALLFGIAVAVLGQNSQIGLAILFAVASLAMLIAYLATRRQVLVFASSGGRIELDMREMSLDDARNVLESAETMRTAQTAARYRAA